MLKFLQHLSCPTRGPNTLDHCYTQFKNAYNARSIQAFVKSDHATIFLTQEYKQRLVQVPPVERGDTLVDWDMFRASSSDVSEFTDVAISYVNMLTEQATEMVTIRTFSNQKPWVDRTIHSGLLTRSVNQRTAAYNASLLSGNMSEYKASCYSL